MLEAVVVMGALAVALFCAVYGAAILVTTVYLHRCLAHGGVELNPRVGFACRVWCWLATGVKPRQWVRVHRWHHLFADSPADPHSPLNHGGGWRGAVYVLFHNVTLYSSATRRSEIELKYPELAEARRDRWDALVFDKTSLGLLAGIACAAGLLGACGAVLFGVPGLVIGIVGAVTASVLYAWAYMLIGGAVNGFGHRRAFGRATPGTSLTAARNVWVLVPLAGGEGRHEYHHLSPNSPRFAIGHQIDPGWAVIRILTACRCATVTERGRLGIARLERHCLNPALAASTDPAS